MVRGDQEGLLRHRSGRIHAVSSETLCHELSGTPQPSV